MQTFIFGHKNPDTDSVCSSIALSYLLNQEGKNTIPKVLGHINQETQFVLDNFKMKCPDYLNDTKVKVKDINYNKKAYILEDDSILHAYQFMQEQNITAVPLVDEKKKLTGLVTLKEIAKYLIHDYNDMLDTTFDNILSSIDGKSSIHIDDNIKGLIHVASYQTETFQNEVKLSRDDIVIVGDRYKIIEYSLQSKVKLIVLTGNHKLPQELKTLARKNKVNVIVSRLNSFDTARQMILSNPIKTININEKPVVVNHKMYRSDFLALATKEGHTNYPVINSKGECLGLLKVTNADNYKKQEVILVDHNGMGQSALGIEEADIIQIIDHHNLSAIGTNVPINFRCMPVGCTCTIIYSMFLEAGIPVSKDIAGLMLSAILSDTLVLKSPTTTEDDIYAANKLAKIARVKIQDYGYQMFKAASSIKGISVSDLINTDFKSYSVGNSHLGIAQVMTMDFDEMKENLDEYIDKLDEISSNYLCVVLFITDVYKNGSYVLYNRHAEDIIRNAFDLKDVFEGVYLDDLVSRKKQMLPALLEVLEKRV